MNVFASLHCESMYAYLSITLDETLIIYSLITIKRTIYHLSINSDIKNSFELSFLGSYHLIVSRAIKLMTSLLNPIILIILDVFLHVPISHLHCATYGSTKNFFQVDCKCPNCQ